MIGLSPKTPEEIINYYLNKQKEEITLEDMIKVLDIWINTNQIMMKPNEIFKNIWKFSFEIYK